MVQQIKSATFDAERSLYGLDGAEVSGCVFAGPADGESPLKECRNVDVSGCRFELRYPFWHDTQCVIRDCTLTESCRAALWYDKSLTMENTEIRGVKAFRECDGITIASVKANSEEFGWKCRNVTIDKLDLTSVYPFFECSDMNISGLNMTGKYSFQYTKNVTIKKSRLRTKDAFWHCKNVTVRDTVIEGEYLGWYSEGLHLINCTVIGTQPFCYAKDLVLESCRLENCDLAFEKSTVTADIVGSVISVKNPRSGVITLDSVGELIMDDPDADGKVVLRSQISSGGYPRSRQAASGARPNVPPMMCVYMGPPMDNRTADRIPFNNLSGLQTAPSAPETVSAKGFCSVCGTARGNGKFCPACGTAYPQDENNGGNAAKKDNL